MRFFGRNPKKKGSPSRNGQPLEYHMTRDVMWLLQYRSFGHLNNGFMNEDRMAHSDFLITADVNGVTGGLIIAEKPWGNMGAFWQSRVTNPLQIGGLYVVKDWSRTSAATTLAEMAAIQAAKLGATPVALTETRSAASKYLAHAKARRGRRVTMGRHDLTPWDLSPMVDPAIIARGRQLALQEQRPSSY